MNMTTVNLQQQHPILDSLDLSSIDKLLFHIAHLALHIGGHRYGSFLDAATTAAKLSVYVSYLEHGHSLNKTGLLHHIETKRVKEIVREVEQLILQDQCHSGLGNQEPEFLIGIPNLWMQKFPWDGTDLPCTVEGLAAAEIQTLTAQLPQKRPMSKIINEIEFFELLDAMHTLSCQQSARIKSKTFSNALREHYAFKVLHSGMVTKIRQSFVNVDLYALVRMSYSPQDLSAKLSTLFSDLVQTFEILQLWLYNSPQVLRALETLEIQPQNQSVALAELDELLRQWADKYHDERGQPIILHLAAGPHPMP
jgi:hypothetical protein